MSTPLGLGGGGDENKDHAANLGVGGGPSTGGGDLELRLQKLYNELAEDREDLSELKEDIREKFRDALDGIREAKNISYVAIVVIAILLLGIFVALFPIYQTWFLSNYLYQAQFQNSHQENCVTTTIGSPAPKLSKCGA